MQAIKLLRPDSDQPIMHIKRAFAPCDIHAKSKNPQVCMCKLDQRASWKNKQRERVWEALWFSQKDTFMAENLGIQMADGSQVFHPDTIQALRDRKREEITKPPAFIFVTIDPAEGGPDKFAIMGHCDAGSGKWVVRRGFHCDISFRLRASSARLCAARKSFLMTFGTRSVCMRPSRCAVSVSARKTTCANAKRNITAYHAM